ncbi:MAG TPA: NAD(+) diphosphatase [Microbacterium sp.]|nr:NAD(+) diphosphatase [Microbacterium sp.]
MTVHADPVQPPLARGELDRCGDEREIDGLLASTRADPRTRVLVVRGDAAPLADEDGSALLYAAPAAVAPGGRWAFLGRDTEGAAMLLAAFARDDDEPVEAPHGWGALRAVGGGLSAFDAGVFVEGLSLGRWLIDAPFCPACGSEAEIVKAGWARRCPSCGREHFPRTDPAVIVAVGSQDGARLLLGSNALWGGDRFSCFAGFVEAGESLEATVSREVHEEAGVRVGRVRYHGSQAWPYPRSLMVGFHAAAIDDAEAEADGSEIVQVRWFTRDEIGDALDGRSAITLPGTASIARSLIVAWHAEAA